MILWYSNGMHSNCIGVCIQRLSLLSSRYSVLNRIRLHTRSSAFHYVLGDASYVDSLEIF